MSKANSGSSRKPRRNVHVTKSGKTIKVNRSIVQRWVQRKDASEQRKAARKASLPQGRVKRFFYHFHPKRVYKYWFSRDGAIMAVKIAGIGFAVGFIIIVGLFAYFRKDLPNLRDISGNKIGGSVRYYDRTGKTLLFEDYDAVKRIPVKGDVAQYLKDATVAVEDKDFFKHGGFDVRGITRAGVNNVLGKGGTQGGSTITQQLVKLTQNWTRDRSYTRKAKELILSVELERSYSKQEILAGYLDAAPYGNVQYGAEAASRDYFQKSAKDLTLDEAAFLASIPKSPSFYSPYGAYYKNNTEESRQALVGRQHYILDLMQQQGMITTAQRDAAKKIDTVANIKQPQAKFAGMKAPWFVLAAKRQLEIDRGADSVKIGGWTVTTTLDMDKQKLAEEQVAKGIAQVKRQGGDTAAFAAEDVKTGQMVALVGGTDFANPEYGQINYAQTPLPPGSSFKPYDYTALIENTTNFGAGSVLYDTQGPIDGYPCTIKATPRADKNANCLWDYDLQYPGPITLRYALGGSRNVPAVKAMLITGVEKTITTAEKLGLKSGYKCYQDQALTKEGACYGASAIGDGAFLHLDEHVHGYASLSRNGLNIPQTYILKVTDANNKTLTEWKPSKGEQVVRPESAYIVADMLSDPNASYFPAGNKPQRYGNWKFGIKTGTTNDAKDGWIMGMSTQYAAGVWVGYHSRQKVMSGFMETMTQPILQGWMRKAHDGLPAVDRVKPAGIQTLPAFVIRKHVAIGSVEPSTATDLFPSWYKQSNKTTTGERTIDKVSGKLATDCTPELAKDKTNDAAANAFSGDRFVTGGLSTGSGDEKDDVHKCSDSRPTVSLNKSANGASYDLSADVTQGTHPISGDKFKGTVNYLIDGQIIKSFNVDGPGVGLAAFTYTPDFAGSKTVSVQIIDSVLYSGTSDSSTISGSGGSAPLTITSPANNASGVGTPVNVSWSGGSPKYTLFLDGGAYGSCSNTPATTCSVGLTGSGFHGIYIKDILGNISSTINIKK